MPQMRRQAPGDLLARVTADTTLLRQIAIQSLVQFVTGSVMLIGALILMAYVDIVLLFTIIGVVLALGAVIGFVMPRLRRASRHAQRSVGAMGGALERALGAFSTVKASGAEGVELRRIGTAAQGAHDEGIIFARWSSVAGTSAGLAIQVAFLVVLGVGGARVDSGAITVATLVAFLLYVMYLTQPVLQLVNAGTYFQAGPRRDRAHRRGHPARDRGRRSRPAARAGARPRPRGVGGELAAADPAALAFDDASLTYPGREEPALAGLTLDVPPGG